MSNRIFELESFFSTVRILRGSASGTTQTVGTGFLVDIPLRKTPARGITMLISNRHVYGDGLEAIEFRLNKHVPGDRTKALLGHTNTFQAASIKDSLVTHSDPDVDLACLNVSLFKNPEHGVYSKTFGMSMFAAFTESSLLPGMDVWFLGYPDNRFDERNNLPILRRGSIASIPQIDFNGRPEFLIDAQVYPGSSGSPVFAAIDGKYKVLGVVAQTMIRNERIQVIPTNATLGVQQILGLGIVIKAPLVVEMLEREKHRILNQLVADGVLPAAEDDPVA